MHRECEWKDPDAIREEPEECTAKHTPSLLCASLSERLLRERRSEHSIPGKYDRQNKNQRGQGSGADEKEGRRHATLRH